VIFETRETLPPGLVPGEALDGVLALCINNTQWPHPALPGGEAAKVELHLSWRVTWLTGGD
jgi:hypothetical protein